MIKRYRKAMLDKISSVIPTFGRVLVVMNSSDNGNYNYDIMTQLVLPDSAGRVRFFTTLAEAYAEAQSNNNDVIVLDANSSHSGAMLTVAKNRVHFFGMDGGDRRNSQGTKLVTPATDVAASVAVIKNTGVRNTFRNIKFIQNGTNVAQTSAFIDEGEGTLVSNCGMEVNSILTTATQALLFAGDACHYEKCQIGNSTVRHTAANQAPLVIKKSNGAYARYSYFVGCTIVQYSSQTTASCIDVPEADGLIGWVIFEDCTLISANKGDGATAAGTMAEAVTSILTSGYVLLRRCASYNATKLVEADASILSDAVTPTAAAGGGIATAGA